MTLIVLGHNLRTPLAEAIRTDVGERPRVIERLEAFELFAATDSAITIPSNQKRKTILSGFRKVYPIPIRVWQPSFVNGSFTGYHNIHSQYECFLAIAGSTLTAQHVINSVTEHLGKLRITHEYVDEVGSEDDSGVRYKIVRHCEHNRLITMGMPATFDESLYLPEDIRGLLDSDKIAHVAEFSIEQALRSARKYKLDRTEFDAMRTEFALGVRCPITEAYRLFQFQMDFDIGDTGVYEVRVTKTEILPGQISVLGMANKFKNGAQVELTASIQNALDIPEKLFEFLNEAIDHVHQCDDVSIDRPAWLLKYNTKGLTLVSVEP